MVVSTLSCEFCGVLVASFWGFWKHQPSQFPSLMPRLKAGSLHFMSLDDFSKRLSDGTVPVAPNTGVLEKVWDPTAMSETQRVEGCSFSHFLKDGLVFSDWKMMGCWLCIIYICCFRLVQCSSWRFERDLPSWHGPLFQMGGSTTTTYLFILLVWVTSCGHTGTLLLGRSSIKDDMDFFQRNGG